MGRVTLQTIADHVGVSRMTVSNAFSRPDQLSARLRGRVLAVADELGYVGPDPRREPWPADGRHGHCLA
jgi:DNA-binding LacI/PurR family transcriptional regulator